MNFKDIPLLETLNKIDTSNYFDPDMFDWCYISTLVYYYPHKIYPERIMKENIVSIKDLMKTLIRSKMFNDISEI